MLVAQHRLLQQSLLLSGQLELLDDVGVPVAEAVAAAGFGLGLALRRRELLVPLVAAAAGGTRCAGTWRGRRIARNFQISPCRFSFFDKKT